MTQESERGFVETVLGRNRYLVLSTRDGTDEHPGATTDQERLSERR